MLCFSPEDNLQCFGISLSQSKQQDETTVLYTQTMKHVSVNNKCCKSVAQSVPGGKPTVTESMAQCKRQFYSL